jgi:hypothetical protein
MIDARVARIPDPRLTFGVMAAMVAAVTVLQRLAVPFAGDVSLALLIVLAAMAYLLISGAIAEDRVRTGLYLLAVTTCLLAASVTLAAGREASFSSLLLLVVLYAPFAYVLRPEYVGVYPKVLEFFCRLMVVGAVLSLGQWMAQVLGWKYTDPFSVLPQQLVLQDYNTTYPLEYGSSLMKSNGFVFLEPSFCSQLLALAAIVQLVRGDKRWRVPLYVAGIVPTVSGTGLLLLAFGLVVLSLRRGPLWGLGVLAASAVVATLVAVSPAGDLFAARAAETRTRESSVSLRSVDPYERAYEQLGADNVTPFIGHGPGFVEREAADYFQRTDLALAFPVIPKLIAEYGLIAGAAFLLFTVVAFWSGAPSPTIAASVLFMHLTLSGSLLQPQTVYLGLLLASIFASVQALPRASPRSFGQVLRRPAIARDQGPL